MPVGKTKDAGWEIGVSRTVPHPPDEVWRLLTGPEGLALWLGEGAALVPERGAGYETDDGTAGEVRSFRPLDRVRITWHPPGWTHDSTVQVALTATTTGTTIRFHQDRLANADERERQRAHWAAALDRLRAVLDGA